MKVLRQGDRLLVYMGYDEVELDSWQREGCSRPLDATPTLTLDDEEAAELALRLQREAYP